MNVLVTGARGFIGRNLTAHLRQRGGCTVLPIDVDETQEVLRGGLNTADVVFHLAGVNRPQSEHEFDIGNALLTRYICETLQELRRTPVIVMSSSVQAALDNPYGLSKRKAEGTLREFATQTGARISIHRLKNVFGKWCRPNYNSVVATFCHNVANDLPLHMSDPDREIDLVYVDDVVEAFAAELEGGSNEERCIPSYSLTIRDLAGRIQSFHDTRTSLFIPDFAIRFNQQLYGTYLSYLPDDARRQQLQVSSDHRGQLSEFLKSRSAGQFFVSRTKPGITRGNHYHHTKSEKFFVVEGEALIRMRHIERSEIVEYRVRGESFQVVDIPPGYAHSIENIGLGDLVVLFWADEVFDPDRPDTYFMPVVE